MSDARQTCRAPKARKCCKRTVSKRLRVHALIPGARRAPRARLWATVGVDAELEPLGVHVVRHRLDAIRERLGVGDEAKRVRVAVHRPAVVDVEVHEARLAQAVGSHRVCHRADVRVWLSEACSDIAVKFHVNVHQQTITYPPKKQIVTRTMTIFQPHAHAPQP